MSTVTYRQAINGAIADALAGDHNVFMLGEDIGAAGGAFKTTDGLIERFGEDRVLDTPISEQAIIGTAIGAAIKGLRPIAELMFADFSAVCFDQIANQLAKYRYMTGGQVTLPVTIRLANGAGNGFASQHSQSVENWFLNVPGLKIAVPGSPRDAYDLLLAAVRDDDPVLYFEHKAMLNLKGDLDPARERLPLGRAEVVRPGSDVTVVATQLMRVRAEDSAEALAADGISVELIDPRTLVPLDVEAIVASVERTNRLLVVQEAPRAGGWGTTVVERVVDAAFDSLDAPPVLVAADETPIPYAATLENAWMPAVDDITASVIKLVRGA